MKSQRGREWFNKGLGKRGEIIICSHGTTNECYWLVITILSSSERKRNAMIFSSGNGVKATVVGTYAVVTESVHRCCWSTNNTVAEQFLWPPDSLFKMAAWLENWQISRKTNPKQQMFSICNNFYSFYLRATRPFGPWLSIVKVAGWE